MTIHERLLQAHVARLTVRDFLTLADAGSFDLYARSELIEGEIWVVNAVHRTHARIHAELIMALGAALRDIAPDLTIYSNPSTELSDDNLPEPDIVVARRGDGRVLNGNEVLLAVEVSVSTLEADLGKKLLLYAAHSVPEYWVIDAEAKLLHQFWKPGDGAYLERREFRLGEPVRSTSIDLLNVETDRL